MTSTEVLGERLGFGNLCEAPFLLDAYVDLDSDRLKYISFDGKAAERRFKQSRVDAYVVVGWNSAT